ncbi:MAG TPA: holo-ACP synthase [Pyrinomonadaceae bacterium]|nr:holo-ACP synthase [Pyrinomonadaceae bacterium]HMP65373.1 holo-ACP synthase [Pyrinomonadaceae bacterium]
MIVSTGIDIIEVYRIRESLARTERFGERVFTEAEREYCDAKGKAAAASYAARFAAKEAMLKALKTGWSGNLAWHDIEIMNDERGAPHIELTGEAARLHKDLGSPKIHLTLSHTSEHAVAQVILEMSGR